MNFFVCIFIYLSLRRYIHKEIYIRGVYAKYVVVVELLLPLCSQCLWTNGVGTAECVSGTGRSGVHSLVAAWLHPAWRQTQHSTLETATHTRNTQSRIQQGFSPPSGSRLRFSNGNRNNVRKQRSERLRATKRSRRRLLYVPHTLASVVGLVVQILWSEKATRNFWHQISQNKIF